MAQMHRSTDGPTCPGCGDPLEPGDLFCGACGYDLSAVATGTGGGDRPTVALSGGPVGGAPAGGTPAGGTPVGGAPGAVAWPPAAETDSSHVPAPVHVPGELPGLDSAGTPLSVHPPTPPAAPRQPAPGFGPPPPVPPRPTQRPATAHPPVPPAPAVPPVTPPAGPPQAAVPPASAGQSPTTPPPAQGSGAPLPPPAAGPAHAGDFELPAPHPPVRTDAPGASTPAGAPAPAGSAAGDPRTAPPAAGAKLCVACRAGRVDLDGYCENCGHAQPRERDHMEQELGAVAAVSDRGLRHHRNEDAFAVSEAALPDASPAVVAIVCDGVSSATRPDEASAAAAARANESLLAALPRGTHPQQAMHEAIVAAAEAVNALAPEPGRASEHEPHRHQNAPACTIVGAVVASGLLVVGWIGDSRAYWVPDDRDGPPARLTEDDSWAAQMVAAGLMNEAEAYADERAHAITGWLGADAYELEPHTASFKPDRPGVVVVCTDGLWNYAEGADDMARVLPPDAAARPLHAARVLVGHALDGGGHDNVTVALVPFAVPRQGAGSA
ncbi:PP2C family serine/threonine-protein phosphatase [Streptomyces liangshanensis]|uniref:PP2C family serine/threonine-protein phosphatase n=1 Tax=Streptomyces liangshanensis TaxID=2717324 RepID=UPI0036DA8641